MKLSIVIPVYNTQSWLPKCLDSMLPKEAERTGKRGKTFGSGQKGRGFESRHFDSRKR